MKTIVILLAMTASASAEIMFSDSQCRVLKQMHVDTRGGCPAHIRAPVQVRSPHADEAAYEPAVSGIATGGLSAESANRSAGIAGSRPDGPAGVGEGDSNGGQPGGGSEPGGGRPGFGGGERGDFGGDNRPVGKPPPIEFKPEIDRKPVFKPPDLTKEQKRRLISKIRKEREESDWNPGNIGKPGRPGKAHEGRNSR